MNQRLRKVAADIGTFLDAIAAEQGPSGDYVPSDSRRALDLSRELLAAWGEAQADDRWIPCGERLPEEGERSLVICAPSDEFGPGDVWVANRYFKPGTTDWVWFEDDGDWQRPEHFTHWRPLPAPPT